MVQVNDQLFAEFIPVDVTSNTTPIGSKSITIGNWTSYNVERDFFVPADAFTLVCEDDRADQLNNDIQLGMKVRLRVNNNTVLIGYVDDFQYTYNRSSGKQLTITGRDVLGMASDATVFPNLNQNRNVT